MRVRRPSTTFAMVIAFALPLLAIVTGCQYGVALPAAPSGTGSGGTTGTGGTGATAPTYTTDVQPILSSSCVRCHGPSRRDAGVDLSTYANVMRYVTPGSANSLLIAVTQPGGLMYGQLGSGASTKATTIRNWIVNNNAAQ